MTTVVPESLFHTVLSVTDYLGNSSASARRVYVLGTHSNLEAAKRFAETALTSSLHFEASDFAQFKRSGDDGLQSQTDGAVVFAKAHSGQEFVVAIATTLNTDSLAAGPDGGVVIPTGGCHLHYVLQTRVDYSKDRSGQAQSTDIEGCFVHRDAAIAAARACLLANKTDFAQYDERSSLGPSDDWPYGEEVLVHAVCHYGENFTVSVTIPPDTQTIHKMRKHTGKQTESHARLEAGVGMGIAV